MRFNEQYTVENHIISFFEHQIGYDYIPPNEFKKLREFETEYLIIPHLKNAIKRINKLEDNAEVENVIREIKKIETNEGFLEILRNGVNLKDPKTGKNRDYAVVEWGDSRFPPSLSELRRTSRGNDKLNHFVITNQFTFEGNEENIRADMIVFLKAKRKKD